ncbi:MAG: hypothetical protein EA387_06980 [Nitriliruptor sp.]|nr:MAG: hypothetical protein EA387_06980 [Nitriliruptor sp.]
MLLALREAVAEAEGASLDLGALARRVDADREVVHAALLHAVERGWLTGVEVACLPVGCGTSGCTPEPARAACRRCPLAR